MKSFLDSVIPGIRCQNPNCRAVPPANNPITVQMLLYDGWMCRSCGEEYRGALKLGYVETTHGSHEVEETPEPVAVVERKLEHPKDFDDMKRHELVAVLSRFKLNLDDVPVTKGAVSNADIRAYLVSKVPAMAEEYVPSTAEAAAALGSVNAAAEPTDA